MLRPPKKRSVPSRPAGRREQNKSEKLRRIKGAARELFLRKGYDAATMREIADRADVGLGTLFSYAADKRDLLFLIYNDELQRVTQEGFVGVGKGTSFLSKVTAAFAGYYRYFAREPQFMRYVLREIVFYSSGAEASRIRKGRETIIQGLVILVAEARAGGQIGSAAKNAAIADIIFEIFQGEVRRWLADAKPTPATGLRRLRQALKVLYDGLAQDRFRSS
jgi:AcrR family transcriptional regulator